MGKVGTPGPVHPVRTTHMYPAWPTSALVCQCVYMFVLLSNSRAASSPRKGRPMLDRRSLLCTSGVAAAGVLGAAASSSAPVAAAPPLAVVSPLR